MGWATVALSEETCTVNALPPSTAGALSRPPPLGPASVAEPLSPAPSVSSTSDSAGPSAVQEPSGVARTTMEQKSNDLCSLISLRPTATRLSEKLGQRRRDFAEWIGDAERLHRGVENLGGVTIILEAHVLARLQAEFASARDDDGHVLRRVRRIGILERVPLGGVAAGVEAVAALEAHHHGGVIQDRAAIDFLQVEEIFRQRGEMLHMP